MKTLVRTAVLLLVFPAAASLAEVVVLKGGTVVNLQRPPVRKGNNVLLTRADGTLLSVPASDIDRTATAAANAAPAPAPPPVAAPPATLAEAARAAREVPKARVRITDANVAHGDSSPEPAAADADAPKETASGAGRVDVADYSQEKSGEALVVRGTLRNPGSTSATSVRMTVTALDSKNQPIASGEAGISSAAIEPSKTAAFSITIPVGKVAVASLRFTPRWASTAPPAETAADADAKKAGDSGAAAPAAARPNEPPPPAPTPYGRGVLYAAPPPSAPSAPPPDGKTGYIPGASSPSNQPKPPG
jgi:hypothetical protein